jgi:primosomal protein N'
MKNHFIFGSLTMYLLMSTPAICMDEENLESKITTLTINNNEELQNIKEIKECENKISGDHPSYMNISQEDKNLLESILHNTNLSNLSHNEIIEAFNHNIEEMEKKGLQQNKEREEIKECENKISGNHPSYMNISQEDKNLLESILHNTNLSNLSHNEIIEAFENKLKEIQEKK